MSLDKAIEHGKEYRREYIGSKKIDRTCRNHGGCQWCEENRKIRQLKINEDTKEQLSGYMNGEYDLEF